jgi:hypothetical protein
MERIRGKSGDGKQPIGILKRQRKDEAIEKQQQKQKGQKTTTAAGTNANRNCELIPVGFDC